MLNPPNRKTGPRVSVIVTAFNVKPYLVQCLDSLILQDLKQIEIIVVNDGSTDESQSIAMRYSESFPRVHLINQRNQGLSEARNTGIKHAKGEYIGFVDGDDWIHPNMYFHMAQAADNTGADLVITNGYLYNDATHELRPIQDYPVWESLRGDGAVRSFNPRETNDLFRLDTSACKRLYRRSHLERLNFSFLPGIIFEDVPAHYRLLLNTHCVTLVDRPYYYYRTDRPGRITSTSNERLFNAFDILEQVIEELRTADASLQIWANFIWFQSWILRWLRKQIQPESQADVFDRRSVLLAQHYTSEAIQCFNAEFTSDNDATTYVGLQVSGSLSGTTLTRARLSPLGHATRHLGDDPIGYFDGNPDTFMPDIWGWILIEYGVQSVLDIGCGSGSNLLWFHDYGIEVLGVEGHPRAITGSLLPGRLIHHDFTKGSWSPDRQYDLCVCTGFAEHVEAQHESNWLSTVSQCHYLLFASAPPANEGYHHVNAQPHHYWIEKLRAHGLCLQPQVTIQLQETAARKPSGWQRESLLFFEKSSPPSQAIEFHS